MSNLSQLPVPVPPRTPAALRTRSNKSRYKLHSPLKQHQQRSILQPTNTAITSQSKPPVAPFTFTVDLKPTSFMPPKVASAASKDAAKRKTIKQTTLNLQRIKPAASTYVPAALSPVQSGAKRALSPNSVRDIDDAPAKRFKSDTGASSLAADVETASEGGSVPPSSADQSMSVVSVTSEPLTVAAESSNGHESTTSDPPRYSLVVGESVRPLESNPTAKSQEPRTPPRPSTSQPVASTARIEISKTPKAPWLTGSKVPMLKVSPVKKSAPRPLKPLMRTPVRPPADLRFPASSQDLFPSTATTSKAAAGATDDVFGSEAVEPAASSSQPTNVKNQQIPVSSSTVKPVSTSHTQPLNMRTVVPKFQAQNRNVSAAFALPISLSPTKTPAKPPTASKVVPKPSPGVVKKQAKPSILQRAGTSNNLLGVGPSADPSSSKSPLSSTLAALMNRTTVDPHAATQAQLSTLNQALEELDAPRPPSSMSQRPPLSRPSTSLGHSEVSRKGGAKVAAKQVASTRPGFGRVPLARPGSALGVASVPRASRPGMSAPGAKPNAAIGNGHPPVAGTNLPQNASSIEARRASTASFALSQSLPVTVKGAKPPPAYTTQSGRRIVSAAARAAGLPSASSGKESSLDNMSVSNASDGNIAVSPGEGSGNSAAPPARSAPLDILKDCVIFVDVRTEDGEDAGSLFVDMLRGLGAKILSRTGSSLTHIVYKSGLPSTLTKYRALAEPKPAVVGIGWVVECVEKREKVDVARYVISLEEEAGSVLEGLKNTGKATNSKKGPGSIQTKLQFKPAAKGA